MKIKNTILLTVALALTFVLCGCGKSGEIKQMKVMKYDKNKTVAVDGVDVFYIDAKIGGEFSPELIDIVVGDEDIASVSFSHVVSGRYVYFSITGVSEGSTELRFEAENGKIISDKISITVVSSESTEIEKTQPEQTQPEQTASDEEENKEAVSDTEQQIDCTYVLNTNSKKFHMPECASVGTIKDENIQYFDGTRDELLQMSYSPCARCNP